MLAFPRRPWAALACLVSVATGCESARFAAALREDSAAGYRAFLARGPSVARARAARRRLDDALYRSCASAGRPLACHQYLDAFPKGRSARRARARLAALALRRARDEAGLLLVIEKYPRSAAARTAEQRLAAALAGRALAENDEARCRRFLAWFPDADRAPRVREHLAELLLQRSPAEVGALERLVGEFSGTAAARRANERIARILADEIEQTGDRGLLEQLAARFSDHPRLALLRARSRDVALLEEVVALRVDALERRAGDASAHPALRQIVRYCRRRPRACEQLRKLSARAAPWRPDEDLATLARKLNDPDPQQVWRATALLGRSAHPRALEHVAALLGSARIDTVWVAQRTLRRWGERTAPELRAAVLERLLRQTPHPDNLDLLQRHGHLSLLAGRTEAGTRLLERAARSPTYALTARYLVVSNQRPAVPPANLERLLASLRARLRWTEQTFTGAVTADSVAPALLVEREIFAMEQILADLPPLGELRRAVTGLRDDVRRALGRWRARLRSARPGFVPARRPGVDDEVRAHEAARAAAWRALRARRDPPSRWLAEAICHHRGSTELAAECSAFLSGSEARRRPLFGKEERARPRTSPGRRAR